MSSTPTLLRFDKAPDRKIFLLLLLGGLSSYLCLQHLQQAPGHMNFPPEALENWRTWPFSYPGSSPQHVPWPTCSTGSPPSLQFPHHAGTFTIVSKQTLVSYPKQAKKWIPWTTSLFCYLFPCVVVLLHLSLSPHLPLYDVSLQKACQGHQWLYVIQGLFSALPYLTSAFNAVNFFLLEHVSFLD